MSEPWNQWYPHEIDIWQGSGAIQILSDTAYRAIHNIIMEMWKSPDCALEEKELHQASRVLDRYAGVKDEVLAYMDRTEDGRITHFVQRKKWDKAKLVYEARQSAAKKTNKTKPKAAVPSKAPRSAKQSAPIAARSADTLTVTETLTTTKQEQKPSRPSVEGDSRHVPFRLACEAYMIHKGSPFVWDGSEAQALHLLLKSCPALTLAQFQTCLNHRARSPGTPHGERPRVWLPHILKYQEAPLNEFGKTGVSNGNRNSAVEKQQISHDSIAAAVSRRLGAQTRSSDGGSAGLLPEPDTAAGNAGLVAEGVGGNGRRDGHPEVREGVVEGSGDRELHPKPG